MRYLRFLTWVLLVVFGMTTASAHDAPADLSVIHIRGAWARARRAAGTRRPPQLT